MGLNPNAQKAMKLLVAGDMERARDFIGKKLEELEDERTQLYKVKALIPPLIPPRSQAIASKKLGTSPLTKDQRREVIKKYAVEVSEKHGGGKFTVQEVVDAIKANGIELGVDVPNTTVGNVLIKSGEWKRLEKGVFEDIGI